MRNGTRNGCTDRRGADLSGTLVRLVIFAVVFLVLLLLVKEFLTVGKSAVSEKQFQTALLLTKAISPPSAACVMGTPDVVPLPTIRRFISVDPTRVTVDGKEVTKLYDASCPTQGVQTIGGYSDDGLSEEEIKARAKDAPASVVKPQPSATNVCLQKNVLAEEMGRCWKMFFNGEQVVLQQMDIPAKYYFTSKDGVFACYICGEVTLKGADVNDLIPYLQNKPMGSSKASYYDYLAKNPKAWCDPDLQKEYGTCWDGIRQDDYKEHQPLPYTSLPKDNKYAVVFIRRGLGSCDNTREQDTTVFTHQHLTNSVHVVPIELLPKVCDKVAG